MQELKKQFEKQEAPEVIVEKVTLREYLVKHEILDKFEASMVSVIVDGLSVENLDTKLEPEQSVVVLPKLRGG